MQKKHLVIKDKLHHKYHAHPYYRLQDGLRFGIFMFVFTSLVFPLIFDDTGYTLAFFRQNIIVWIIGGLGYGLLMRYVIYRKKP